MLGKNTQTTIVDTIFNTSPNKLGIERKTA